jgi:hemoglobin-like flavoprotein
MTRLQARGNALSERDAELFNDSLERCTTDRRFLDRFYEMFITSSAEAAAKFANTDLRVQKAALKVSLYMIMSSLAGKPEGNVHLERIAARHSRNALDIGPHLYDKWLECLIQAARASDPLFREETEQAWRKVMRVGIEFLKSRYRGSAVSGGPGPRSIVESGHGGWRNRIRVGATYEGNRR